MRRSLVSRIFTCPALRRGKGTPMAVNDRLRPCRAPTESEAYAMAFRAVELFGGSCRIDARNLHPRYELAKAARVLRAESARLLLRAWRIDRKTTRAVWSRHKSQVLA